MYSHSVRRCRIRHSAPKELSPNSFHVQVYHIQCAGALDVNAIDAIEGVGDELASVGAYRVAE